MSGSTDVVVSNASAEMIASSGALPVSQTAAAGPADMIKTSSVGIMVQPRTLMIARPEWYYFEPANAKRKADEGNDSNQIERGVHQVDPNRAVSCAPVMPNLALLRDTGNPYPKELNVTVVSSKRWDKFAILSHTLWRLASEKAESFTVAEIIEEAVAAAGVGYKKGTKEISSDALYSALDTFRDLRLYGLMTADAVRAQFKKTKFKVVEDPSSIAFTERSGVSSLAA